MLLFSSVHLSAWRWVRAMKYFLSTLFAINTRREQTDITHVSLLACKTHFCTVVQVKSTKSESIFKCVCKCDTQWPLSFPAGLVAED